MSEGSIQAIGPPASAPGTGFERLDTLVRVTTIQSWIYLATLFAAGVGAVVFAVFYRVPNKVSGEGILLIETGLDFPGKSPGDRPACAPAGETWRSRRARAPSSARFPKRISTTRSMSRIKTAGCPNARITSSLRSSRTRK